MPGARNYTGRVGKANSAYLACCSSEGVCPWGERVTWIQVTPRAGWVESWLRNCIAVVPTVPPLLPSGTVGVR